MESCADAVRLRLPGTTVKYFGSTVSVVAALVRLRVLSVTVNVYVPTVVSVSTERLKVATPFTALTVVGVGALGPVMVRVSESVWPGTVVPELSWMATVTVPGLLPERIVSGGPDVKPSFAGSPLT
jgi:hypothetical protein